MRLQFVTIGQNVNWPRGRLSLARKKKHRREFMTLARVKSYVHLKQDVMRKKMRRKDLPTNSKWTQFAVTVQFVF